MGSIRSRSGKLFFDFRYRCLRCREQTRLSDTPANRKRAVAILDRIEAEILVGTFDYTACFPNSKGVDRFRSIDAKTVAPCSSTPTFAHFAETWFAENEPRWKHSYKIILRTLDKHILPVFSDRPLNSISKSELLAFRANLAKVPRRNGSSGLSPARINHVMVPLRSVFSPNSKLREYVAPQKPVEEQERPKPKAYSMTWAQWLKRVFVGAALRIEIEKCEKCGGPVRIIVDASNRSIEDPDVIPDASDCSDSETPGPGSAG